MAGPFPASPAAASFGYAPQGMLDGPPPNPMIPGPQQLPGAMGAGVGAPTSRQLAPEVLQGLQDTANTIDEMLNAMASMVPDLATDLAFVQDGLKKFQSKLLVAGGGPSTTAQAGTPMPNGLPPSPSPSA